MVAKKSKVTHHKAAVHSTPIAPARSYTPSYTPSTASAKPQPSKRWMILIVALIAIAILVGLSFFIKDQFAGQAIRPGSLAIEPDEVGEYGLYSQDQDGNLDNVAQVDAVPLDVAIIGIAGQDVYAQQYVIKYDADAFDVESINIFEQDLHLEQIKERTLQAALQHDRLGLENELIQYYLAVMPKDASVSDHVPGLGNNEFGLPINFRDLISAAVNGLPENYQEIVEQHNQLAVQAENGEEVDAQAAGVNQEEYDVIIAPLQEVLDTITRNAEADEQPSQLAPHIIQEPGFITIKQISPIPFVYDEYQGEAHYLGYVRLIPRQVGETFVRLSSLNGYNNGQEVFSTSVNEEVSVTILGAIPREEPEQDFRSYWDINGDGEFNAADGECFVEAFINLPVGLPAECLTVPEQHLSFTCQEHININDMQMFNYVLLTGDLRGQLEENGYDVSIDENANNIPDCHEQAIDDDEVVPEGDDEVAPVDVDGDGVTDDIDNCPGVANADQIDADADGVGDVCVNHDNCGSAGNNCGHGFRCAAAPAAPTKTQCVLGNCARVEDCAAGHSCNANGVCEVVAAAGAQNDGGSSGGSSGGGNGGRNTRCVSDWSCTYEVCQANLTQVGQCVDKNACQPTKQDVRACEPCVESWRCGLWSECRNGVQSRDCVDDHLCQTIESRPAAQRACVLNNDGQYVPASEQNLNQPPRATRPAQLQKPEATGEQSSWSTAKLVAVGVPSLLVIVAALIGAVHLLHNKKQPSYNYDELKSWVKKEKAMGTSNEDITKILKEHTGWNNAEIEKVFGK